MMIRNAHRCSAMVAAAALTAAALAVVGCASSPGGQGPDPGDLELYNGDWFFDAEASRRSEFHYWTRDPVTDDEPPQSVQDELLKAVEQRKVKLARSRSARILPLAVIAIAGCASLSGARAPAAADFSSASAEIGSSIAMS